MRKLFLIFVILIISVRANYAQKNFQAVFPLNSYFTTTKSFPYFSVSTAKIRTIDKTNFINVMDYGAKGDGVTVDDNAIKAAFLACKDGSGLIFPSGKQFLIKNLQLIDLDKDITVYAYGATIKMAENTGYNAIAFVGNRGGFQHRLIWLGGTFDGNKRQQAWPGSPTQNNTWMVTKANYGLLTVANAEFALVKDVKLINTVYDGVDLFECKLSVFADCEAKDGAPLNYDEIKLKFGHGRQATYFKAARSRSEVVYFLNIKADGGSIGVHYSTEKVGENSLAVVSNSNFSNQVQDAIHFEHCRKIFIDSCKLSKSIAGSRVNVHISNSSKLVSITNSYFDGARVNFNNRKDLEYGVVQNCRFKLSSSEKDFGQDFFINNATHVVNCTFDGKTSDTQVKANIITKSKFTNFKTAVKAASVVNDCEFTNGDLAIKNSRNNSFISKSRFSDISAGVTIEGSSKQKISSYLSDNFFSDIKSNSIWIGNTNTILIDNNVFSNNGLNKTLPLNKRAFLGADDKTTVGNVIIQNSKFVKSNTGASSAILSDNIKKSTITKNLTFDGISSTDKPAISSKAVGFVNVAVLSPVKFNIDLVDQNNRVLGTITALSVLSNTNDK